METQSKCPGCTYASSRRVSRCPMCGALMQQIVPAAQTPPGPRDTELRSKVRLDTNTANCVRTFESSNVRGFGGGKLSSAGRAACRLARRDEGSNVRTH